MESLEHEADSVAEALVMGATMPSLTKGVPPRLQFRRSRPKPGEKAQRARNKRHMRKKLRKKLRRARRKNKNRRVRSVREAGRKFELDMYLYSQQLMADTGLTGTAGPPTNFGQALGSVFDHMFAMISTTADTDIEAGAAQREALTVFLRRAAKEFPQQSSETRGRTTGASMSVPNHVNIYVAVDPFSNHFSAELISTEPEEIADTARSYDLEVYLLREKYPDLYKHFESLRREEGRRQRLLPAINDLPREEQRMIMRGVYSPFYVNQQADGSTSADATRFLKNRRLVIGFDGTDINIRAPGSPSQIWQVESLSSSSYGVLKVTYGMTESLMFMVASSDSPARMLVEYFTLEGIPYEVMWRKR